MAHYIKLEHMAARAAESAEASIGLTCEFKRKEGASGGIAYYKGPIVKCEPLPPRKSKTGMSVVQVWKVTIKLPSGKLEEAVLSKIPVPAGHRNTRTKPVDPLAKAETEARPDWKEIDAIVRRAKRAINKRRA